MRNPGGADLEILQPQQRTAVERTMERIEGGATRLMVAMPSGTGRSTAIVSVLLRLERPMLIVAPAALQAQWLSLLRRWCKDTYVRRSSERFLERRQLDAIDIVAPQLVRDGGPVLAAVPNYEWVVIGIGTPGATANRLRLGARRVIVESDGRRPPQEDSPGSTVALTMAECVALP